MFYKHNISNIYLILYFKRNEYLREYKKYIANWKNNEERNPYNDYNFYISWLTSITNIMEILNLFSKSNTKVYLKDLPSLSILLNRRVNWNIYLDKLKFNISNKVVKLKNLKKYDTKLNNKNYVNKLKMSLQNTSILNYFLNEKIVRVFVSKDLFNYYSNFILKNKNNINSFLAKRASHVYQSLNDLDMQKYFYKLNSNLWKNKLLLNKIFENDYLYKNMIYLYFKNLYPYMHINNWLIKINFDKNNIINSNLEILNPKFYFKESNNFLFLYERSFILQNKLKFTHYILISNILYLLNIFIIKHIKSNNLQSDNTNDIKSIFSELQFRDFIQKNKSEIKINSINFFKQYIYNIENYNSEFEKLNLYYLFSKKKNSHYIVSQLGKRYVLNKSYIEKDFKNTKTLVYFKGIYLLFDFKSFKNSSEASLVDFNLFVV